MRKKEVVFVYRYWARFQETTVRMLSEKYDVKIFQFTGIRCIPELFRLMRKDNISIYYFGGRHAVFGNLLSIFKRHKTVVIIAGYEVEDYSYGAPGHPLGRLVSRFAIDFADYIIVVSKYLKEQLSIFSPRKDVFLCYAPNTVDVSFFSKSDAQKRSLVISVGVISDVSLKRKGFETFIECAEKMPDTKFIWAGLCRSPENKKSLEKYSIPGNMEVLVNLSKEELLSLYSHATVYCQLSSIEGFGVALAEAMACECVPVVTGRGGMAEVVGDAGVIVPYGDVEKTVEGIKYALAHPELGKKARQRIVENFNYEKLKNEFLTIIEKIYPS
ncbi:MAG: glycosyltransferase family 4 protein [Thermoplasmata archaeon]